MTSTSKTVSQQEQNRVLLSGEPGPQETTSGESNESMSFAVNVGGYIEAVLDRNLAENISRVLYPNDNVSDRQFSCFS